MGNNAYDELKWRGLVCDNTESVPEMLVRGPVAVYNGFDATADSLHVGHMVPLMALARLQRFGHIPIAVAGGGTSMIGDPSGKSEERKLLSREDDRSQHRDRQAAACAFSRFRNQDEYRRSW